MRNESLKGKNVLITGAARRIGRETALAFADEGANIIVHYRSSQKEACDLCGELAERGVKSWQVQADFSVPEDYETLIERTLRVAGSIDILVNNASEFPAETLEEMTFDSLMSNIQVNAYAPFTLMKSFAFQVGKGRIINMLDSRISGYDWKHVGYILSKHVFAVLTRMCALQFAPGITVNGVSPGLILPPPGQDESYIDRLKNTVPLRRHGEPEDIAAAVIYLAKTDFVTGEVIYVDGGRHLKEYTEAAQPAPDSSQ